MSSFDNDPIIEIFNNTPKNEGDDIHVINRDHKEPFESFDSNLVPELNTPSLGNNQLYNLDLPQTNQDPNMAHFNEFMTDKYKPQMAMVPKVNPLPPLPPLSEPAIPSNLGYQQLTLPAKEEEKKPKKKKEPVAPKTRPVFVMKIWSMVNDDNNKQYIRWNDDGETFQVFHREEFMKKILPKYFKHNNFASFVRQLNMYGWHKVQDISNGTLLKDDRNSDEIWQFANPNFKRGREDLLDNIVRNRLSGLEDQNDAQLQNLQLIMGELDQIKMNQIAIGEDLRRVRKDNATLWSENYMARDRYQQQAQTLDKILKFLATVYGNSSKVLEMDSSLEPSSSNAVTTYNNYNNYDGGNTNFNYKDSRKPRLMLTNKAHERTPTGATPDARTPQTNQDNSPKGSIEEIMRTYNDSPADSPGANVNKMYQQLVNDHNLVPSPRHFFPELNSPRSPLDQYFKPSLPLESVDTMDGLEQNIIKQGHSIQQVQDWIQKLATQQQQQQQQLNEAKESLEDFDVNEFLDNNSHPPTPLNKRLLEQEEGTKRIKREGD